MPLRFSKLASALLAAAVFTGGASEQALSQQYRNFEAVPDGRGGAYGSYGGRNFQIERDFSKPPPRRYGDGSIRVPATPETNGTVQRDCYVNSNGRRICR